MNGFNQLKLLNGFPHFPVTKKERKTKQLQVHFMFGEIYLQRYPQYFQCLNLFFLPHQVFFALITRIPPEDTGSWLVWESQVWQILSTEINRDDKLPWGKHLMSSQSRDISAYVSPHFHSPLPSFSCGHHAWNRYIFLYKQAGLDISKDGFINRSQKYWNDKAEKY